MKALYLDGRRDLEVLLDGPALRVRGVGRADGRYPLARLSRVVTLGEVRWRPHALLACFHFRVPVAILDPSGRFVRLRFSMGSGEHGLARHLGELLGIARYQRRYQSWLHASERREMAAVAGRYDVTGRRFRREHLWQAVVAAQSTGPGRRVGRHYAYLRGLTTAHVASLFSRIGLPNDAQMWSEQEYRFLNDIVWLEHWRHVDIVSHLLARGFECCDRRALTEAFESRAEERERRIAAWRQGLLFELLGVHVDGKLPPDSGHNPRLDEPLTRVSERLARVCDTALGGIGGNIGLIPHPPRDSLRTSVKILRIWLEYDRRAHELF